jgi:hypothetical protein
VRISDFVALTQGTKGITAVRRPKIKKQNYAKEKRPICNNQGKRPCKIYNNSDRISLTESHSAHTSYKAHLQYGNSHNFSKSITNVFAAIA